MTYTDYQWFIEEDLSVYAGKWIAILNKQVVASGRDPALVVKEVKQKFPTKTPLLTKVRNRLFPFF
jgi:hypothetical protein